MEMSKLLRHCTRSRPLRTRCGTARSSTFSDSGRPRSPILTVDSSTSPSPTTAAASSAQEDKTPDDDIRTLRSAKIPLEDAINTAVEQARGKGNLTSLEIDIKNGATAVWQIEFGGDHGTTVLVDGTTVLVDASSGEVIDTDPRRRARRTATAATTHSGSPVVADAGLHDQRADSNADSNPTDDQSVHQDHHARFHA
jgi:uncharacterized membrane protein YkoI